MCTHLLNLCFSVCFPGLFMLRRKDVSFFSFRSCIFNYQFYFQGYASSLKMNWEVFLIFLCSGKVYTILELFLSFLSKSLTDLLKRYHLSMFWGDNSLVTLNFFLWFYFGLFKFLHFLESIFVIYIFLKCSFCWHFKYIGRKSYGIFVYLFQLPLSSF